MQNKHTLTQKKYLTFFDSLVTVFKIFFIYKCIKIIFFIYFLKIIFDINASK